MSARLRPCIALALCLLLHAAIAAESPWIGRPLQEYIEALRAQGLAVNYSSDLVWKSYTVQEEPADLNPTDALRLALQPYGLVLVDGPSDRLLITHDRSNGARSDLSQIPNTTTAMETEPLAEVIVTSSLYNLGYETAGSHTFLDQELTTNLPDLGEEPVRAVLRLPGIANGGVSTRNHIRGGLDNEQLFLVDGLRLYEPYHLKDFHSVATIVNQGAIAGIDLHSAGYQARFGDRMSGVVDISLVEPPNEAVTELGFSFFNTSLMSMGRFGGNKRGDWLISVRRGNLDLISDAVNSDLGSPRFQDLLARIGWQVNERSYLSVNFLTSFDKIDIATSSGSENAKAKYVTRVGWLKLQTDWSEVLSSSTILSLTDIDNTRLGTNDNPGVASGLVDEENDFEIVALKQDWKFSPTETWAFSSGFNVRRLEANYRYDSTLLIEPPFDEIFDNQLLTVNSIRTSPSGNQYAVYFESRWRPFENLVIDLGFRWDQQTYTTSDNDDQTSPRVNLMYRVDEKTVFKVGFGQFYQAQEINELQVSDGVEEFFPAQRAQHFVTSLSHRFDSGLSLRLELYKKEYHSLMPRFENAFDALVLLPELQIDRVRIDSGNATAKGAELMLSGERGQMLWWVSYTWADIKDQFESGSVPRSWDQPHTLKGGLNWDWKKWNFSAAGSAHTGWPKTELAADTIIRTDGSTQLIVSTERNSQRHSIFNSVDIRASRRFDVSRGELTGFMEITNLYNRENPCCTEYTIKTDEDGNETIDANEGNWLPLIPSMGIVWRF
jgi:hypothetical protein